MVAGGLYALPPGHLGSAAAEGPTDPLGQGNDLRHHAATVRDVRAGSLG